MINKNAFRALSYGLYLVSSKKDGKPVGCVVNTFAQVTSNPAQVSIAINKDNFTTQGILESGTFEVVVLDETASMDLIGTFGFHSSKDTNKFASVKTVESEQGIPYVTEGACAHFSVKVSQQLDLGSHIFFVGSVLDADILSNEEPMTYAYYHEVKGGRTPKNASSFSTEELEAQAAGETNQSQAAPRVAWRCTLCGHIEYMDELPEDYTCPICGATREFFERIEL
jgi:flavin reductase (DIM6/NTAB) family NADH-FMN oxidoreductase RutF